MPIVNKKDYAIYDNNDALIFVGKFKECVEYLGYTNHETLHDVISRTRRGLRKSGCRVYEIEDDD